MRDYVVITILVWAFGFGQAAAQSSMIPREPVVPKGPPAVVPKTLAEIENCNEPVIMVVLGEVSEKGFAAKPNGRSYGRELRASGLYERLGGHYIIGYPILETFEHAYPSNGFTLIAEFPCLAAAQGFYYSDEYQEIIPLRDEAGRFQFTVYPKRFMQDMFRTTEKPATN